jgi:hypothetical protein
MAKKAKSFLLLNWKRALLIPVGFFVAVVFHNLIYAFFGIEEALFLLFATVFLPLYLLASIIYTAFHYIKK